MYLLKTDVAKHLDLRSAGFITEAEVAAQIAAEYSIIKVPIKYCLHIGKGKLSLERLWRPISRIRLTRKYNPVLIFLAISGLTAMPAKDY